MPSGRDSFRRNRVAPTGTTPIIPPHSSPNGVEVKPAPWPVPSCGAVALKHLSQVRLYHIQNFVTPAVQHCLDQVNSETLGLFELDRGWQRELLSGYFDADQRRTRMGESRAQSFLKLPRVLHIPAKNSASIGELGKVRIDEIRAEADHSYRLHFQLHETQRVVLIDDDLHRRFLLPQ